MRVFIANESPCSSALYFHDLVTYGGAETCASNALEWCVTLLSSPCSMFCSCMLDRAITVVAGENHDGRHRCKDLQAPLCLAFTQGSIIKKYSLIITLSESQWGNIILEISLIDFFLPNMIQNSKVVTIFLLYQNKWNGKGSIHWEHNELYCSCTSALITEMIEMKKSLHFPMALNFSHLQKQVCRHKVIL